MDFHLALQVKPFSQKISIRDKILLAGSCFTEHIGQELRNYKFSVLENPNGILFNPVSISKSVTSYIENRQYKEDDLFYYNELWTSWQHHSRFSHPVKEEALRGINDSQQKAHAFLKKADWLMLTLGSAFVYELGNATPPSSYSGYLQAGEIVANCHKIPADKFNKRLPGPEEVISVLDNLMHRLFLFNPGLKIIFTISPVRHLRDGFVENNRSKAVLIQAVHQLVDKFEKLFYFPAYELVIDDLRDYRFYAEDMVHPNYAATGYVWDKFTEACIDDESKEMMKEIQKISMAAKHKAFHPSSAQHKQFLAAHLAKAEALQSKHPFLDLSEEISYFSALLSVKP
ncbi:MAG: GSCFA domain-containing protein [Chitinophagaceae bacterium]|nr:GSCFA domain-containing protein [Chitinophagaceae bacterium]